MEGVIDVHYARPTFQGVQAQGILSRWSPILIYGNRCFPFSDSCPYQLIERKMINFKISRTARSWEVNSTWLITSELANQRAPKVLFRHLCGIH